MAAFYFFAVEAVGVVSLGGFGFVLAGDAGHVLPFFRDVGHTAAR